jgi:hypothetical protein
MIPAFPVQLQFDNPLIVSFPQLFTSLRVAKKLPDAKGIGILVKVLPEKKPAIPFTLKGGTPERISNETV